MKGHVANLREVEEVNERFRDEARRLGLRYRCWDCAHVVPSTGRCSMGFPNAYLRTHDDALAPRGDYTFCKYFELGEQG